MKLSPPKVLLKLAWTLLTKPNVLRLLFLFVILPHLIYNFGLFGLQTSEKSFISNFVSLTDLHPVFAILLVIVLIIVSAVVYNWYTVSLLKFYYEVAHNHISSLTHLAKEGWRATGHFFLTGLLVGVFTVLGLIAFVIPGILMIIWYMFATIIAAVEEKHVNPLKMSKLLVQKAFWPLVGRSILFGLLYLVPLWVFGAVHQYMQALWASLASPYFAMLSMLLYIDAKKAYLAHNQKPGDHSQPLSA